MSDLNSLMAIRQSTHHSRQPRNILKSRTKRTVNNEMEEKIKPSSTAPTRQTPPTSFSKTTIAKSNGDKAVEINLNIQLPSMPPSESATSASNEINDLKELIKKKQTHQIQALQIKMEALEIKDAEKILQIQKQNSEIHSLKNSIKNQTENYLFILDSNSKLWSAVNNLEKQISSNILKSTNDNHELEHVMEKEITFSDIKKYVIENPNRAKDVEEMAKNIREKYEPKKLMVDEYDIKCYRRKMEQRRKHYQNETDLDEEDFEKLNKQKNARNWLTSTVDDKLEKYGIRLSSDDSVKWEKRPRNVQKLNHRHRSPSPTNSIISDSSCESDSECSTFSDYSVSSDRTIYLTDITQQPDQYDDNWNDFDDDEDSVSQMSCGKTQNDLEEVLSKLKSISKSLELLKEVNNQNSEIMNDNNSESINASTVSNDHNKNSWKISPLQFDSNFEHKISSPALSEIDEPSNANFSNVQTLTPQINFLRIISEIENSDIDVTAMLDQYNDNWTDDENW